MEGPPYNQCRREGKAEIHRGRLDRTDASPHGLRMTGGTTDRPNTGKPPPAPSREERLAQALRANLRRRKAPSPAAPAPADPPSSETGNTD